MMKPVLQEERKKAREEKRQQAAAAVAATGDDSSAAPAAGSHAEAPKAALVPPKPVIVGTKGSFQEVLARRQAELAALRKPPGAAARPAREPSRAPSSVRYGCLLFPPAHGVMEVVRDRLHASPPCEIHACTQCLCPPNSGVAARVANAVQTKARADIQPGFTHWLAVCAHDRSGNTPIWCHAGLGRGAILDLPLEVAAEAEAAAVVRPHQAVGGGGGSGPRLEMEASALRPPHHNGPGIPHSSESCLAPTTL